MQLALGAEGKLCRVVHWLGDLKQVIDQLNQTVADYQDQNSVRMEITDVFEPMLQLLADLIKFQHTWVTGKTVFPCIPSPYFSHAYTVQTYPSEMLSSV
jgi:hypothetical protein